MFKSSAEVFKSFSYSLPLFNAIVKNQMLISKHLNFSKNSPSKGIH